MSRILAFPASLALAPAPKWHPCITPRWFSSNSRRLQKQAVAAAEKARPVAPGVKGIPYSQLTIGVPKEILKNERR